MATTSPDNIWTPDSGDDYALTVDLAATADTVQDALTALRAEMNAQPLIQRGTISFVGDSTSSVSASATFPLPFASEPTVIVDDWVLAAGQTLVAATITQSTTGFTARMGQTGSNPGFGSTYTVGWIAIGERP